MEKKKVCREIKQKIAKIIIGKEKRKKKPANDSSVDSRAKEIHIDRGINSRRKKKSKEIMV